MYELKLEEVFRISFDKGETGKIEKTFDGLIRKRNLEDIELGLSIVINHIYMNKETPDLISDCACTDHLFLVTFAKNAMDEFKVKTYTAVLTKNDCENIITGLLEMLMKLHLERMVHNGIKITLAHDERTSPLDFKQDSELV